MISDQEFAGLDILTNGDYHLDTDLAGRSWFSYPSERLSGISDFDTETTAGWAYPIGTVAQRDRRWLEVPRDRGQDRPARAARIREDLAGRAVANGETGEVRHDRRRISPRPFSRSSTDLYDDDKRELMWDLATILNAELRQLVAAGCKVVQIEEPAIHSAAAWGADEATLDFFVDLFNYTVEGLDDAEIWVHTCWGNPGAQHWFQPSITYEASLEIFLERINADVWTIESKHNGHSAASAVRAVQGEAEQEDRRGDDQPSRASGRDRGRGRGGHSIRA